MVATGTVEVFGRVDGANANLGAARIVVTARSWASMDPPFTVQEIASNVGPLQQNMLRPDPRALSDLGNSEHNALLPEASFRTVTTGPNSDASYMLAMHTEQTYIRINRDAFQLSHPWVQNHYDPASPSGRCSKPTILGLETKAVQHEGLFAGGFNNPSHAFIFRNVLQGYDPR